MRVKPLGIRKHRRLVAALRATVDALGTAMTLGRFNCLELEDADSKLLREMNKAFEQGRALLTEYKEKTK